MIEESERVKDAVKAFYAHSSIREEHEFEGLPLPQQRYKFNTEYF